MDSKIMATAIEVGWFIATMVGIDYCIRTFGAMKTLWWTFAITSVVCLSIAIPIITGTVHASAFYLLAVC